VVAEEEEERVAATDAVEDEDWEEEEEEEGFLAAAARAGLGPFGCTVCPDKAEYQSLTCSRIFNVLALMTPTRFFLAVMPRWLALDHKLPFFFPVPSTIAEPFAWFLPAECFCMPWLLPPGLHRISPLARAWKRFFTPPLTRTLNSRDCRPARVGLPRRSDEALEDERGMDGRVEGRSEEEEESRTRSIFFCGDI